MTQPYSMDLRERVVDAILSGSTVRDAASRFGVAVSTAVKWSKRHRLTGSVAPGKIGGHRRPILRERARVFILSRIAEKPDLTIRALQAELLELGIEVSRDTVWVCLKGEGLSCKKNRVASRARAAQDRALPVPLEGLSEADRSKTARLRG